jgi:hypothetical protein
MFHRIETTSKLEIVSQFDQPARVAGFLYAYEVISEIAFCETQTKLRAPFRSSETKFHSIQHA